MKSVAGSPIDDDDDDERSSSSDSPLPPSQQQQQQRTGRSKRPSTVEAASDDHDDHAPAKRQKRTTMQTSCESCRQRKTKCDRAQPSCGWCSKNGEVCKYRERRKPGLRAGYGRELEARLDRLEELLRHQQNAINQVTGGAGFPSTVTAADHHPTQHEPNVSSSVLVPAVQATTTATLPGGLPSPSHTSAQIRSPSADAVASHAAAVPLEPPTEDEFPPFDLLYSVVDLYFKHVNTWCPILHRTRTIDALFGSSVLDEGDRVLMHAIVATTLRFSTDPRLTSENRERYHEISKQKVMLYGLENSSVKALQALVILALDLVGFSNGPPGWHLLAIITRSAVQLGLTVESTSDMVSPQYPSIYTLRAMVLPEPKDWVEEESRRRLFWMVYLLDRYATVATAFEFALDEKEIDRKLPSRDDLFMRNEPAETRWFDTPERNDRYADKSDNLGAFAYYIEVIGLLSRIHRFLKKPVDIGSLPDVEKWQGEYRDLDNALNVWKYSLPGKYGKISSLIGSVSSTETVTTGLIMLHAAYNMTVIRLHSSAAYPTSRSIIFTPSYAASQRCLSAVEKILSLTTYLKDTSLLLTLGPPFAFSLWVAARVLLVHGSTVSQSVNPRINELVATLRAMGKYWQVADRYATLLQRVLDEYQVSQRAPLTDEGNRETPSSVTILADMRRCAYDLEFLIARQPKSSAVGGQSRRSSLQWTRQPQPVDFEYLDVFDFFNMPRLPVTMDSSTVSIGAVVSGLD